MAAFGAHLIKDAQHVPVGEVYTLGKYVEAGRARGEGGEWGGWWDSCAAWGAGHGRRMTREGRGGSDGGNGTGWD